jgi:hypothetical protein
VVACSGQADEETAPFILVGRVDQDHVVP